MNLHQFAETHDVTNQPPSLDGANLYRIDVPLQEWSRRFGAGWAQARIDAYGALAGGPLMDAGFLANQNKPVFSSHDRYGHRIDLVEFHPAYHELMRTAVEHGLPSLPWAHPQPGAHVARAAMTYLHSQAEAGTGCPLTMTFACVPALRLQPDLAGIWLPKILSTQYDPRNVGIAHTSPRQGSLQQYITETLPLMNPDPVDCICENLFLGNEYVSSALDDNTDLPADFVSSSLAYLQVMQRAAKALGKPYYIGSFGLSKKQELALQDTERQDNLHALLSAIRRTGVQLACYWAWNAGTTMEKEGLNLVEAETPLKTNYRTPVWNALRGEDAIRPAPPTPCFSVKKTLQFQPGLLLTVPSSVRYESADFSLSYCIRQQAFSTMVGRGGAFVARQANLKGWTLLTQDIQTFLFLRNSAGAGFNNNGHGVNVDSANRWFRCTYTVKHDGSISLYVDDFLMSQGSKMATPFVQAIGAPLVIGRTVDALEQGAPAWQLSDVILYDRVLTPKEVYDYGQYGIVHRPVGRWKLDGSLEDSSGFGNHATTPGQLVYADVA